LGLESRQPLGNQLPDPAQPDHSTVLPKISVPENDERFHARSRSEASAAGIWRRPTAAAPTRVRGAVDVRRSGRDTSTPRSVAVFTVDVVQADAGTGNDLQFRRRVEHLGVDVVPSGPEARRLPAPRSSFSRSGPSTRHFDVVAQRRTVDSASL